MEKDTKNLEIQQLEYGRAVLIAKKFSTTPQYVSNVLSRARSGHQFRGIKARKIIRYVNKKP